LIHSNFNLRLQLPNDKTIHSFYTPNQTPAIYTLSLHDALPISSPAEEPASRPDLPGLHVLVIDDNDTSRAFLEEQLCAWGLRSRSEEHTSELQSRGHLVCRLLLEKKKKNLSNFFAFQKFCNHIG